jgi:glycosyltransferase involved in cell wall biosynthesis
MQKKKILIFIDWYLPGYKAGGPIQSIANLVEHLKDEFDFSIVTRDTDYCETTPYATVKSNQWNTLANGVKIYYISSDRLNSAAIRNIIRETDFDVVHLNGIYSLYFTLIPLLTLRKKREKKIVLAVRGMLAPGSMNVKKRKKQFFIRTIKISRLFNNVIFHVTTPTEKGEVEAVFGEKMHIKVAANLPQKNSIEKLPERIKTSEFIRLVNVARVAPEKNLLFALQILKQVKCNVEFDFYGPIYNQEYWSECKVVLDELPQNIKAKYKGSIESDKVLDLLKNYHFMFMPTTGENFGHIILQSLSVGCPVIISDRTPWKALKEKNVGWDIPLDAISEFAGTIDFSTQLNQVEYDKMSDATFRYAQEYINDPGVIEQNRHLFL